LRVPFAREPVMTSVDTLKENVLVAVARFASVTVTSTG
jgi:hypothetical protein